MSGVKVNIRRKRDKEKAQGETGLEYDGRLSESENSQPTAATCYFRNPLFSPTNRMMTATEAEEFV
jgi:hypothetical protein